MVSHEDIVVESWVEIVVRYFEYFVNFECELVVVELVAAEV